MSNIKKRILSSIIILPISVFFILKGGNYIVSFLYAILILGNFEVFSAIIPGRFMIIYTFIAWPILLSLIYCKFKDKFFI